MSIEQTVENVRLRYDAVTLTRKHFWRLLGMSLLLSITILLAEGALTFIGDLITKPETDAAIEAVSTYIASPTISAVSPASDALKKLFTSGKFWLYNIFYLVVMGLLNNGLMLGFHAQMLTAADGERPKVLGCFCRMRHCFKAWRLAIWTTIKLGLWALPGLSCIFIGSELLTYGQLALGDLMIFAGIVLLFVLTARAGMSYCMASYILADEPDRGVRECVTFSKGLMQYRRWQGFKLGVPMVLKLLGVFYAESLLFGLFTTSLGENPAFAVMFVLIVLYILVFALSLFYFLTQFDMVYALFYRKRRDPVDTSTSYWLRDPAPAALPEEAPAVSPADINPENTEEKENQNEEPVC